MATPEPDPFHDALRGAAQRGFLAGCRHDKTADANDAASAEAELIAADMARRAHTMMKTPGFVPWWKRPAFCYAVGCVATAAADVALHALGVIHD